MKYYWFEFFFEMVLKLWSQMPDIYDHILLNDFEIKSEWMIFEVTMIWSF